MIIDAMKMFILLYMYPNTIDNIKKKVPRVSNKMSEFERSV